MGAEFVNNRPEVGQGADRGKPGRICRANQAAPIAFIGQPVRNGYVRLHGRNYQNWFAENKRSSDRYDRYFGRTLRNQLLAP
jgi:hypothetical protein